MSIAFTSIIVILVFAPGIIFRRTFLSGDFSRKHIKAKISEELIWSSLPALVIHLFAVLFISKTAYHINWESFLDFVSGSITHADKAIFSDFFWEIALYNFSLITLGATLGYLLRKLVIRSKLDITFKFLRFPNIWYYYFSGRYLDFPEVPDEPKDIEYIIIDALVDVKSNDPIIYTGILTYFELSSDGNLDHIILQNPIRRKLSDDPVEEEINPNEQQVTEDNPNSLLPSENGYYDIPGDIILLRYDTIINLNIKYFALE